jgi:Uma2 family endonuclease
MGKTAIRIGPADHGRRMTLADFEQADTQAGYLYELARGVIVVSDVPKRRHLLQVSELRRQLTAYELAHPGVIDTLASGNDCKIVLVDLESERHPDWGVYKNPPSDEEDLWSTWIPDLVIEVVSPGSEERDYVEKREEYLAFGVKEYWIVDADKQQVLVLRRSAGRWVERVLGPAETYQPGLLPGFQLNVAAIFQAAGEAS